ncbi:hypothetical protein [Bifidobacterium bombi]|uniref:hypothetical protein n=1 Tax=Bifidobacterium bombi TaxID=471511 RepID=UPI0006946BFD|nr:hypothetical protein [Bifidobacterium bombi]
MPGGKDTLPTDEHDCAHAGLVPHRCELDATAPAPIAIARLGKGFRFSAPVKSMIWLPYGVPANGRGLDPVASTMCRAVSCREEPSQHESDPSISTMFPGFSRAVP